MDGRWYWSEETGRVFTWNPGAPPVDITRLATSAVIFNVRDDLFASSISTGELLRLREGEARPEVVLEENDLFVDAITCSAPFSPTEVLVGTNGAGFMRFDGEKLTPFVLHQGDFTHARIADICVVGEGLYAAAVDSQGIVFFNRTGRVLQMLDSSLDNRLGRASKLRYGSQGALWALLKDGIAKIGFPNPVSHFEPLIPGGLNFVRPIRYEGDLWLMADGDCLRAVYEYGRLTSFERLQPEGRQVYWFGILDGQFYASTEIGFSRWTGSEWELLVTGIANAVVGPSQVPGRFIFVGRGSTGIITLQTDGSAQLTRFDASDVGNGYAPHIDGRGHFWV